MWPFAQDIADRLQFGEFDLTGLLQLVEQAAKITFQPELVPDGEAEPPTKFCNTQHLL